MLFGRENGDTLDYGHGDLLFGENAPLEVYPRILRWVSDRASPVPGPRPGRSPRTGGRLPSGAVAPRVQAQRCG